MSKKSKEIAAPPETEEVPELQEFGLKRHELGPLSQMIVQHGELGVEKRMLEKERNKLTPKIKAALGEHGIGKAFCGDWRVSYFNTPRESLSTQLLLEHGISPATIKACTVTKDVYTLRISPRSEPEPKFGGEEG